MRLIGFLFGAALFAAMPSYAASQWRGDMLQDRAWNEEARLEGIVHYPRPSDVFRRIPSSFMPDADMFDHAELKRAPREDMFTRKSRAKPQTLLFDDRF